MSQIEKQIANSLFDSNGTSSGAGDCYKIALEFAKGFAEYVSENKWWQINAETSAWMGLWKSEVHVGHITTDQLIDKYLEHLETIK